MTVKALMPVRNLNLVVPLAHEATAMRTTDNAATVQARSGAVAPLIGASLRPGDVDSTTVALTPGTRTSTTATRTTTTRAMRAEPEPSADPDLFHHLVAAYLDCRCTKRNSDSALAFEARLEHNLCSLHEQLVDGTYRPGRSICFVVERPKVREVWAATFADRVVHHLLYNRIAPRFLARFTADSCACIPGRGTLYAARRLEHQVRSATHNWQRPAHYLKVDLANFFVSINKHVLLQQLQRHVTESWWLRLTETVLMHDPRGDVELRGRPELLQRVPPHKSLFNAPAHKGLPIGNLSSQFFANAPEYADLLEGTTNRYGMGRSGSADTCTDPDCFDAKKKAHLKREADKLASAGKVVVDGNAARNSISARGEIKGAYVALKDVQAALDKVLPKNGRGGAIVAPAPQVVLIQDPRTGKTHKAVKRADVQAAGVKVSDAPVQGSAASYAAQEARRNAERAANEAKAKVEHQVRRAVLSDIRDQMAGRERDAFDLQLVAQATWCGVAWRARNLIAELWGFKNEDELEKKIGQMDVQQLTLFVMDCAIAPDCLVDHYELKAKPTTLLAAARHYGIDVEQVRAEVTKGASTPSTAARAKVKAAPASRGVRYRCPDTGSTWSGKGLQPRWLKVALASGKSVADFDVSKAKEVARSAGKDDEAAGDAGGKGAQVEAFEEAAA